MCVRLLLLASGAIGAFASLGQAADPPRTSDKTVSQRLEQKIDVKFRRIPLQDAFAEIGRQTGVSFTMDGDSLKLVGYTRNMSVDLMKTNTQAIAVVRALIKRFPELRVMLDEDQRQAIVTTPRGVKQHGEKGLVIEALPDVELSDD